ncbi:uncharacterized protein A4U43_C01F27450 [Asparagus officinalis]|uniref:ZF-HD dimerization-type domain-containing protein n=1 Tax=Asparagus officinalis TaxID=4686 RepID=A0A5P1FWH4_ASPOF|nr:zinc-finger homeodomain protein 6-like [Asparagus officinalis]ONK81290.1 uncharacterized protein A4U43_C01F27450 [Asparagus officinalis]
MRRPSGGHASYPPCRNRPTDNSRNSRCRLISASASAALLPPPNPNPNPNPIPNSQSSSEEKNNGYVASVTANVSNVEGYRVGLQSGEARKKRFRTKFSPEQKEKMRAFAGRVGWRIHKKDEGEMERFCNEIGVSRQVVKVWMHNNKHLVTKKQDGDDQEREVKVEGEHQNQVDGV